MPEIFGINREETTLENWKLMNMHKTGNLSIYLAYVFWSITRSGFMTFGYKLFS